MTTTVSTMKERAVVERTLTTDSDEILIFTPERVDRILDGLELRRLGNGPEGRPSNEPITVDDVRVLVTKKGKKMRSSGELLIIPGSLGFNETQVSNHILVPTDHHVNLGTYEDFCDDMFWKHRITEPDEEHLQEIYESVKNKSVRETHVYMSHDGRSFSINEKELAFFKNKHYPRQRVLYRYDTVDKHAVLHKQTREGQEGYYLRGYGKKLTNGEMPLPRFEHFAKNELLTKLLSLFLDVDRENLQKEYEHRKNLTASTVFPDVSMHKITPLLSLPGWRTKKNETLTQALTVAMGGKKPRKDFVRAFARHVNSLKSGTGYETGVIPGLLPYVLSGAVNLVALSKEYDMGLDMEDMVIKILQKHAAEVNGEYLSFTGDLLTAFNPSPYSTVQGIRHPKSYKDLELDFHYLASFVGASQLKKILSSEITVRGIRGRFDGTRIVEHLSRSLQDIARMIRMYSNIEDYEARLIQSSYAGNKRQKKEALETVRLRVSDPERDLDNLFRNAPGWEEDKGTLVGLHDALSHLSRQIVHKNKSPYKETPESPLKTLLSESSLSLTVEKDRYEWKYPENNATIINWAGALNNCMASYIDEVQSKGYELVMVEKNAKPYAALGVTAGRISMKKGTEENPERTKYSYNQFYRKNNISLPRDLEVELLSQLEKTVVSYTEKTGQMVDMKLIAEKV